MKKKLRHGEKVLIAGDLLKLLSERHKDDVFVRECKDGPSQGTTHFRMDAWAMNRSWSNATSWAYEIKVTRADFQRDGKWHAYLPYCNEFYFVCPQGLIDPAELPPEAGVIYATANGAKLFTKRRAMRRPVEVPECVYRYILMCRATIDREWFQNKSKPDPRAYWSEWLKQNAADKDLGQAASKGIARRAREMVADSAVKQRELEGRMKGYDRMRSLMVELGFSADTHFGWAVEQKMRQLRQAVPNDLQWKVDAAVTALSELQTQLRKVADDDSTAKGAA